MDGGKAFKVSLSQNLGFMPAVLQRLSFCVLSQLSFCFYFLSYCVRIDSPKELLNTLIIY